jgi:cyclophilin family peptidyl-prolyl cis-trans isomerase
MARQPDQVNPEKRSNGSQFYICLRDLPQLDGQYTVFGKVLKGMDVVDSIAQVAHDARDIPLKPVYILKAYVEP